MRPIQRLLISGALACSHAPFTSAQPGDTSFVAFDRFGHRFNVDQLVMADPIQSLMGGGGCTSAGIFNLDFSGDPGFTPARQAVACQVFADLSALLVAADDPYTNAPDPGAFVNITIFSGGLPAGALAAALLWHHTVALPDHDNSPLNNVTITSQRQGVLDGEVWRTINVGPDSWRSINYAIRRAAAGQLPRAFHYGRMAAHDGAAATPVAVPPAHNSPNVGYLGCSGVGYSVSVCGGRSKTLNGRSHWVRYIPDRCISGRGGSETVNGRK